MPPANVTDTSPQGPMVTSRSTIDPATSLAASTDLPASTDPTSVETSPAADEEGSMYQ